MSPTPLPFTAASVPEAESLLATWLRDRSGLRKDAVVPRGTVLGGDQLTLEHQLFDVEMQERPRTNERRDAKTLNAEAHFDVRSHGGKPGEGPRLLGEIALQARLDGAPLLDVLAATEAEPMRLRVVIRLAVEAPLAAAPPVQTVHLDSSQADALSGVVLNKDGPVEGAVVNLQGAASSVTTDANGRFLLHGKRLLQGDPAFQVSVGDRHIERPLTDLPRDHEGVRIEIDALE